MACPLSQPQLIWLNPCVKLIRPPQTCKSSADQQPAHSHERALQWRQQGARLARWTPCSALTWPRRQLATASIVRSPQPAEQASMPSAIGNARCNSTYQEQQCAGRLQNRLQSTGVRDTAAADPDTPPSACKHLGPIYPRFQTLRTDLRLATTLPATGRCDFYVNPL